MSNATTTIDIAGLDLRPLVRLREPAADLVERLRAGDRSAIPASRALLDEEDAVHAAARGALAAIGVEDRCTFDNVSALVSELGTGDLGYCLDVLEGRCT